MKKKVKYIAAVIIFLIGFVCYLYGILIWQDNNTVYTLQDCTQSQKEKIESEIGIVFPTEALVEEIKYRYTWGNDIPRYYEMKVSMTRDAYQTFKIEDTPVSLGEVKSLGDDCIVEVFYRSDGYTPLASWMTEQGEENRGYKNAVAAAWFVVLVIVSCIPIVPYKKILRNGV